MVTNDIREENDDTRWSKNILYWTPNKQTKRGTPPRSWRNEVPEAMDTRVLKEEDRQDRKKWRLGIGLKIYKS